MKTLQMLIICRKMFNWYWERIDQESLHPWDKHSHDKFIKDLDAFIARAADL